MKITFLGTSHGVPARGRNCSSAMVESGDSIYFIDAGAPLIEEFLKLKSEEDLKRVRAIFTTHSHGDHTYGIMNMAALMNWYYKLPLEVYLTTDDMKNAINALYSAADGGSSGFNPDFVKLLTIDPENGYEDENVKLSFIPNAHMKRMGVPSYSILFEAEGRSVLFSGDFSQHLSEKDVPEIVTEKHLDLFVCEMAHFSLAEIAPYLKDCKADRVYFNHIWRPVKFNEIRAAISQYNFDMRTVDDGDVVEI